MNSRIYMQGQRRRFMNLYVAIFMGKIGPVIDTGEIKNIL